MEKSMLLAGFGGQGVQTLGKLIAYAANEEDRYVTFSPAYGGEMRGGTSNCTVVVSDNRISSPTKKFTDITIVLNEESMRAFEKQVKPGGTLIVNSSLVKTECTRSDIQVVRVPFNEEAAKLGTDKVLNVIALGVIVSLTNIVSENAAKLVVGEKLGKKAQFRALNEKAFQTGIRLGNV